MYPSLSAALQFNPLKQQEGSLVFLLFEKVSDHVYVGMDQKEPVDPSASFVDAIHGIEFCPELFPERGVLRRVIDVLSQHREQSAAIFFAVDSLESLVAVNFHCWLQFYPPMPK